MEDHPIEADLAGVKAIVFDTFGTVVDWRGSIIRDLSSWGASQAMTVDWAAFADMWRSMYEPQKDRVRNGEIPWTNLDELHYAALGDVLANFGMSSIGEAPRQYINNVWHRLDGWPDAVAGLERLRRNYIIGPLSNGNVRLLVDMAKHGGLPWDALFSCELFRQYKPHPDTYLGVCRQLYLQPDQVMMCAAHNDDLRAARSVGLKTAFIPRPTEYGDAQTTDLWAEQSWDVVAVDMNDLATRMRT